MFNKRCGLFLVLIFLLIVGMKPIVTQAASKNASETQQFVFTVPGGGLSTAKIFVNYTEYYSKVDSYSTYNKREVYYAYKMTGATVKPTFSFFSNINARHESKSGSVIHRFTNWTKVNSIVDGKWDAGGCYKNGYSNNYAASSKCKGKVSYSAMCTGAIVPIKSDTVTVNLY